MSRAPRIQDLLLQRRRRALLIWGLLAFAWVGPVGAGSTGSSQLFTLQGAGAGSFFGDALMNNGSSYFYYIEVPSGLASFTIELFDAEIGVGTDPVEGPAGRDHVRAGGGGFNTTCTYSVTPPGGTETTIYTGTAASACPAGGAAENAWCAFTQSPATPGHWQLRVRCATGDDSNAFGLRAHDGTVGSGGTELPIYYDSYTNYGRNDNNATRSYNLYPWITRNCTATKNDFDADESDGLGTTFGATFTFTSRLGSFSNTSAGSGNDVWLNSSFGPWTDADTVDDYGIWNGAISVHQLNSGNNRNYLVFSLTDGDATLPGPGSTAYSQQDSNAFRIYLSTDAIDDMGGSATAPPKPYLRQMLAFLSGSNPAQNGMTSRYAVSIGITNPTSLPITFSASNFVRSLVPTPSNGTVTFQGINSTTPGTIAVLATPAIGGTGFVDWNPGTLAAGATASIAYLVDVTPTMAGSQTIEVTGIPGNTFSGSEAGTTARYVDETGNTTQARATYTFGPICQLSVSTDTATYALVSDFDGYDDDGRLVLEWRTATEVATTAFDLYRIDAASGERVQLNAEPILALTGAPQGGVYRWVDEGVSSRGRHSYVLVEHDSAGRAIAYGPYTVEAEGDRGERPAMAGRFDARPRVAPELPVNQPSAAPAPLPTPAAGSAGEALEFDVAVREPGLYRLDYESLLAAADLGRRFDTRARRGLSIRHRGQEVAWTPGQEARSALFYAEGIDSPFTRDDVFQMSLGQGRRMASASAAPAGAADPSASFPAVERYENDAFPATALGLDPASDYWFWRSMSAGTSIADQSFQLAVPHPASSLGQASLALELQGVTATGVAGEHTVEVRLNGQLLGEVAWQGAERHVAELGFSQSLLQAGSNQLELHAVGVVAAGASIFYVDAFELAYERLFESDGASLLFSAGGHGTVSVGGFASADVRLLDVSDPAAPVVLTGGVVEGTAGDHSVRFSPPSSDGRYLAWTPAALRTPTGASVAERLPASFGDGADYLVIAPAELTATAQRLADHRQSAGHTALVVALEAIYGSYRHGVADPEAIRDFLADALGWTIPPRYLVLAGQGSYDYRNLLGSDDRRMPPRMVLADGGLFAGDMSYGDLVGDDGVPEVIVGRLPVLDAADLDAYVDKVIAYELAGAAETDEALLLADNPDMGGDFPAAADSLAAMLEGWGVSSVEHVPGATAQTRADLFAALDSGATFLTYLGHGGVDRLAAESLLTIADVPSLAGLDTLPVVTALSCTIGRFEIPAFPSLAEELVRQPGAAIAVLAPSGLSLTHDGELLGDRLLRAVYQGGERILGEAIAAALAQTVQLSPGVPRVYNLFGDPAPRLQLPPPLSGPDGPVGDV